MEIEGGKPRITIKVSGSQKLDEASQQALNDLGQQITRAGYDVDIPIRKTASATKETLENVAIFIAGGVSSTVLSAATKDIYDKSKTWAMQILGKRKDKNDADDETPYIVIFGPDGKPSERIKASEVYRELRGGNLRHTNEEK
jgi:hypothetical protein